MTSGGRGWFGTVQGGCDYQFGLGNYQLVIGAFGDYDFADIHGRHAFAGLPLVADEKLTSQWAVGGRIGWVALPSLMVYFSGGYTEARFDRQNYTNLFGPPFGIDQGAFTEERTYEGLVPGRWRRVRAELPARPVLETEYRVSEFSRAQSNVLFRTATGLPTIFSEDSKKWVQTVRSELVYRFNWSGVGAGRYSSD